MDITPIIEAVIALVGVILATALVPWLRGKLSEQEMDQMLVWVEIAVAAAQQLYHQLDGVHRKEYVVDFLRGKGYDVSSPKMDAAIEAAVLKLHRELEGAA